MFQILEIKSYNGANNEQFMNKLNVWRFGSLIPMIDPDFLSKIGLPSTFTKCPSRSVK
jgi:hypothetical protein